ncbi:MAG: peptidoglycan-binding protein [Clostridia bacterium]|nr:peptidoglycan-binding protein [Clostridia bacterium]
MPIYLPYVPEYIVVHLGAPDEPADNVVVSFLEYIKNVASSEIYPTWEDSAIVANMLAQVSFALNRVYTEFYRAQGYDFNITNNTAYDQKFIYGRTIFDNINQFANIYFNDYIRRVGYIEPLAAKYCNGTTVTCEGLSQWGSQNLAEQNYNSTAILYYYYGDDIEIVRDAPIQGLTLSYPGYPISFGETGEDVAIIQVVMNRISQNFPAIPKIYPITGYFGELTQAAVETFQEVFNLPVDGIVDKSTWYQMIQIYIAVTRLAELESEGQRSPVINYDNTEELSLGDSSDKVEVLQYFLSVIFEFVDYFEPIKVSGVFDQQTKEAVMKYQENNNLDVTGVVNEETWQSIYSQYRGIVNLVLSREELFPISIAPFSGTELKIGSVSEDVRILQENLNRISTVYTSITPVAETGSYGKQTRRSVIQYQERFGIPVTGRVNEYAWNDIGKKAQEIALATTVRDTQFVSTLKLGDSDATMFGGESGSENVGRPINALQSHLRTISAAYENIPTLIPDGVFDETTQTAVEQFQIEFGLEKTGEVDLETWRKIVDVKLRLDRENGEKFPVNLYPADNHTISAGENEEIVYIVQSMLKSLSNTFLNIPDVDINGINDEKTSAAILEFKKISGQKITPEINRMFWDDLQRVYNLNITNPSLE